MKILNLINEFKKLTGVGGLINTSFNVRGEPIVNSPEDAFKCFMNTEMDFLVIGNFFMRKKSENKLKLFKRLSLILYYLKFPQIVFYIQLNCSALWNRKKVFWFRIIFNQFF